MSPERCLMAKPPDAPPRAESDNAYDDVHEHPTEWPDEVSVEPSVPHPRDPIEASTEPRPEHPERTRKYPRPLRTRRPER